jgi:hypothetical protein
MSREAGAGTRPPVAEFAWLSSIFEAISLDEFRLGRRFQMSDPSNETIAIITPGTSAV